MGFFKVPFVLMDERLGRCVAEQVGLRVVGTLGLIAEEYHDRFRIGSILHRGFL